MDDKILALEALKASQDATKWAYWAMLGTWISSISTLVGVIIAIVSINAWKSKETASAINQLNVAVFSFQNRLQIGRERFSTVNNREDAYEKIEILLILDKVHVATFISHNAKLRKQASVLYTDLCNICNEYMNGKIDNHEAIKKIVKLRVTSKLLNRKC